MTAAGYTLGRLRPGASRGGDCHVNDLSTGLRWDGSHGVIAPQHYQIDNGLLRLTVSAAGTTPALTISAVRGRVNVDDLLSDILSDVLPGEVSTREWIAVGTLTIDSPSVSALLTGVRLVRINPEVVIVRLVAPLMADAFVTLPRGCRSIAIQHGSTRPPFADVARRIRWTAAPSPVGTVSPGRVAEMVPTFDGFPRTVFSLDEVTADAGAFSLTTASVTSARLGAGVGTWGPRDTPSWTHRQVGNASRPEIVVREVVPA